MTYQEAAKQAKSRKPPENMMLITLFYSYKVVVPYKDGLKIIESLSHAEMLTQPYHGPPSIKPLQADDFKAEILSQKDYQEHLIAQLLGISLADVKEMQKEPA